MREIFELDKGLVDFYKQFNDQKYVFIIFLNNNKTDYQNEFKEDIQEIIEK